VVGRNALELDFWVDAEGRNELLNALKEKGSVSNREFDFRMKSGEIRTGLLSARIANINSEPSIVFVAVDITERKRAERALEESEGKYRDFLDNTNDIVQSVAPDGRFIYVNRAWYDALGYSEKEVPNLRIFNIIHPDYLEHCRIIFNKLISGEDVGQVEAVLLSKGGDKIIVEGNVNCKFVDGQPVCTRGIFRDVTRAKDLEDKVSRLSSAFSISTDCIYITDSYSKIIDVNGKSLEVYGADSKNELIGRHFLEIIAPDERKQVSIDVKEIMEKGNIGCRRYHFTDKKGAATLIQISTSTVKDALGEAIGMVRVGRVLNKVENGRR
jgi:PAS domain S-box-containing protein